jgi:hypothetical protein
MMNQGGELHETRFPQAPRVLYERHKQYRLIACEKLEQEAEERMHPERTYFNK